MEIENPRRRKVRAAHGGAPVMSLGGARKHRIVQLTPCISYGDAVSNDIFALSDVLTGMGYENIIVSIGIAEKVKGKAFPYHKFTPRPDDILLFHMSVGSEMSQMMLEAHVHRKLMVYHNITPAKYFQGISEASEQCRQGRIELAKLAGVIDFALCDSDYNRRELEELHYKKTATLPIVFDKNEYLSTPPDEKVLAKYTGDGIANILFVGRIVPNKKQEDILHSFAVYQKYINPKARLFLVGAVVTTESYMAALERYIQEHHIKNVIFPGHIRFSEILAYYRTADLFLCESEHEGFCVPLLEAMVFDVPVLAYSCAAIPDTLGESGVQVTEKDHVLIAETMNLMLTNNSLRQKVIEGQRRRLSDFDMEKTKARFAELIAPWLE